MMAYYIFSESIDFANANAWEFYANPRLAYLSFLNLPSLIGLSCNEQISNKFYFTFTIRPEVKKDGLSIRNVVPATEEEARRVLERMDAENSQLAQLWSFSKAK